MGKAMWQEASEACDKVMEFTTLQLEGDYFANFAVDNEGSTEIIWAIPLEASITNTFPLHNITLHSLSQQTYNITNFCWDGACALEWLWDSYEENDLRRASWLEGPQYDINGEPLMIDPDRQLNYTPYVGPVYDQQNPALLDSGVRMCKWEYENGLAFQAMSNDFPIYRLADIYLLKAECLMRLNGGTATQEAVNYANMVRERAGASPVSIEAYSSVGQFRSLVRDERTRELCFEVPRRMELRRFGEEYFMQQVQSMGREEEITDKDGRKYIVGYQQNSVNYKWLAGQNVAARHVYFPIPQSELNTNPTCGQNIRW